MFEFIIIGFFLLLFLVIWNKERAINQTLKEELKQASEKVHKFELNCQKLELEKEQQKESLENQKKEFKSLKEQFSKEFENLANKIFDDKSQKFKQQSDESLQQVLKPFKEKLKDFETKVDKSFGDQAKEGFSLKEQIERIVDVNKAMTLQTQNLTKALKGDSKTQGNWGEVILEKILEDSGLRENIDYIVQGVNMGLKDGDSGRNLRPDVIINLPGNKHVIIDAKVSLTAYSRFCEVESNEERVIAIKSLYSSMLQHIKGLEQRAYQQIDKLGTPDFVLMFVPIEGAYSLVVQNYPDLQSLAWDKKIIIVCPATLFATLKTVYHIWSIEQQNINSREIADAGVKLYDKVAGFVEDMDKLGHQLSKSGTFYNSAMNKLSQGKGNILSRLDKMKNIGLLQTRKKIPIDFKNEISELYNHKNDET